MDSFQIKSTEPNPSHYTKVYWREVLFRIFGIIATFVSIGLMVTNHQTTMFVGIELVAKYSYSPAFKYFVAANALASISSAISLLLVLIFSKKQSNLVSKKYFIIFIIDLMATMLELTGSAAATSIGYLGLYGNQHVGWMKICDQVGKFCHRSISSILVGYVASIVFLFLTILSSWKSIKQQSQSHPIY